MMIKMEIVKTATLAGGRLVYQTFKNMQSGITVYGIKISSTLFSAPEEHIVSDVTVNPDTINILFDLCVENAVLPSTLQDIVEDFIICDAMSA